MRCSFTIAGRRMRAEYNTSDPSEISEFEDLLETDLYTEMFYEFMRTQKPGIKIADSDTLDGGTFKIMLCDFAVEYTRWLLKLTNTEPLYTKHFENDSGVI